MKDSLSIVAEALTRRASVDSVFGQPIVVGGRTYLPVARIQYGLGGGETSEGPGAGGGLEVTPLGLVELGENGPSFFSLGIPAPSKPLTESGPGIFALHDGGWLLVHEGRCALVNPPAPGAWLQQVEGPVDLVIGEPSLVFPQARCLTAPSQLWSGELAGEPLFVLAGASGVVFRGVLLLAPGQAAGALGIPEGYRVHTTLGASV
ncbi:hypothetical protein ABS71_18250 [bacterium SCN 62-11]|nr:hypothetical protein [Candidatus Eremiobacteraeota bacterium]ODT58971.1 MAG: hypothetical protein ABS71_18250 [bacterium SCN 62-11]